MMRQLGFIRSKAEIKYLILYVAERLIAPVSFEAMQELILSCDTAIDYFEFAECINYLDRTAHLRCKDGLYDITRKGLENGRACADEIPYSVRLKAEKLAEEENRRIKRARQVQSKIEPRSNGTYGVTLRFSDDDDMTLWMMELTVPDEKKAKDLSNRFQESPEKMYTQLIALLYPPEKRE